MSGSMTTMGRPSGGLSRSVRVARQALVTGWGRATRSGSTVAWPVDELDWDELLATANGRGIVARGAGSGYGDVAHNAGGLVAMTTANAAIGEVNHGGGTVTVDAGVMLADLLPVLAPMGWTLPVVPGTTRVTIGGAIAADVHGKNHVSAGTFGAHVLEMTVLTPVAGRVTMSPEVNADAFWATVGGLGLTGVIRKARLRLRPLPATWMHTRNEIRGNLEAVMYALVQAAVQEPYTVAWIDAHRRGRSLGAGVVSRAGPPEPAELSERRHGAPSAYGTPRALPIPRLPGTGIVRPPIVALANRARLTGARWRPERLSPLGAVLHPLDAAYGLPGLYGRRGLVQYQFVVPFGAEDVVTAVLTLPQAAGCPATLAVLKVFGDQGVAPLSFPMAGWSLAMDFPAAAAPIARVLDELDDRVAAAGGRVYLVKDSRLRPELLEAMYPRLRRWRQIRAAMDPQRLMVSDLARRLGLTSPNGRRDA